LKKYLERDQFVLRHVSHFILNIKDLFPNPQVSILQLVLKGQITTVKSLGSEEEGIHSLKGF
jgi:hypothetical protein